MRKIIFFTLLFWTIPAAENEQKFNIQQTNEIVKNYMKKIFPSRNKQFYLEQSVPPKLYDFAQQELSAEPKKLPSTTSVINKWVEEKTSSNNFVRPRQPTSVTYNRSSAYNQNNQIRGGVSHIKRK